MELSEKRFHFWVGLFVCIGVLSLLFLLFKVTSFSSSTGNAQGSYRLVTYFDNIGGLKVRAPVRSAGIVVGRVAAITLDTKTYRAKVWLDMSSGHQFPKDSSLRILTAGILGEQYLSLDPGSRDAMLANNDRITFTQSALILEDLIGQFLVNKASE